MTTPLLVQWDIEQTLIETRGVGGQVYAEAFTKVTGRRPGSESGAYINYGRIFLPKSSICPLRLHIQLPRLLHSEPPH
jgi:hypothetical protein